ncbi:hypothetical protein L1987_09476 [Smallanthus sonchifolius]|uniref:Uncharacterized protein n=1 Tax=Smallanthus sonchifolius TaxID=185202 RepID=A0ACB9JNZ6_9ASTR|nr:hypothetical protein L1987_09476 [Smallanthus sonchifolius]
MTPSLSSSFVLMTWTIVRADFSLIDVILFHLGLGIQGLEYELNFEIVFFREEDQWMKHRLMQLEEQKIHIQAQMLELEKERFVAKVSLEKRHGNGDDENGKRANGVGIEA